MKRHHNAGRSCSTELGVRKNRIINIIKLIARFGLASTVSITIE